MEELLKWVTNEWSFIRAWSNDKGVARVAKFGANNRMHSDSKKRHSSFLVALHFASGDAERYTQKVLNEYP